jgi:hypothetical protein
VSRFWLVEVESDLATLEFPTTRSGVWWGIAGTNGVKSVTDLRAITLETLCTFLMSDQEFADGMAAASKGECSPYNLIRAYWKRVRQPRLPLEAG